MPELDNISLHKRYPLSNSQTKKDLKIKFMNDYKGIKNIRPLDHITVLCQQDDCPTDNNDFKKRMRYYSWYKNHHQKYHKEKKVEVIIASHLESSGAHYINYEYKLSESHKTKWGKLHYLDEFDAATTMSHFPNRLIDEFYGVNSNKYRIGSAAMLWLQGQGYIGEDRDIEEDTDIAEQKAEELSQTEVTQVSVFAESQNQVREHDAYDDEDEDDDIMPQMDVHPSEIIDGNLSTRRRRRYSDLSRPLNELQISSPSMSSVPQSFGVIDDPYYDQQYFDLEQSAHIKHMSEHNTMVMDHNKRLIDEQQRQIEQNKKVIRQLKAEQRKNEILRKQVHELSTQTGMKPSSSLNSITHYLTPVGNQSSNAIVIKSRTVSQFVRNEGKYIFILETKSVWSAHFYCGACFCYSKNKRSVKHKLNKKSIVLNNQCEDESYFEEFWRMCLDYHLNKCNDHKQCMKDRNAKRDRNDECIALKLECCYQMLLRSEPYIVFEEMLYTMHRIKRRSECKCDCCNVGDKNQSVAECEKIFDVYFQFIHKELCRVLGTGNNYTISCITNLVLCFGI